MRYKVAEHGVGSLFGLEEAEAVIRAMQSDYLTGGPIKDAFEKQFARYTGARYAAAVSSCTAALLLASEILRLGPGTEVISTPQTFIATILGPMRTGARVRFADIDPNTLNMDPDTVEPLIGEKTRAIFVTHYGGRPAEMDELRRIAAKYHLRVVEDAAHAPGAVYRRKPVGGISDITCFSFHSLKNMTTLGEGGMLTTNDRSIYEAALALRSLGTYGETKKSKQRCYGPYDVDYTKIHSLGLNLRMNEIQSAVGLVQLRKLRRLNQRRAEMAGYLDQHLSSVDGVTVQRKPPDGTNHVHHLYTVFVDEKKFGRKHDRVLEFLEKKRGIQVIQRYFPLHLRAETRYYGSRAGDCPVTEEVYFHRQVNLPIGPHLTQKDLDWMIDSFRLARRWA